MYTPTHSDVTGIYRLVLYPHLCYSGWILIPLRIQFPPPLMRNWSFQRTSHLGCSAIELSTRGQHYDPLHTFPLAAYSSEVYQISPSGKLTHGPHKVSHSCVMVFSTKVGALCLCFTPRCRGVSPQGVQAEPRFHAIWLPHLSSKHTENSIKVSPHGMSNEGTLLLTSLILIFNFQLYRC